MSARQCYVIDENCFGRKIIVRADNPKLAWSGSKWVGHQQGIGFDTQVSNFNSEAEADDAARAAGLVRLGLRSRDVTLSPLMLVALWDIVRDYKERNEANILGAPLQWVGVQTDEFLTVDEILAFVAELVTQ